MVFHVAFLLQWKIIYVLNTLIEYLNMFNIYISRTRLESFYSIKNHKSSIQAGIYFQSVMWTAKKSVLPHLFPTQSTHHNVWNDTFEDIHCGYW